MSRHHWTNPRFRLIEPDELVAVLTDHGSRHPRAWRTLAPRLGLERDLTPTTARAAAARLPAVVFRPATH